MIKIDNKLIMKVSAEAKTSSRQRKNYNFHEENSDLLQRMLNAMEPGTYVQPHKHENPDKREAFILLKGKFLIVSFDENGTISDHFILDKNIGNFGVEIPPRMYHTIISLESGSVVYELKDGPYDVKVDKGFARWAPQEGDPDAKQYLADILNKLNIHI